MAKFKPQSVIKARKAPAKKGRRKIKPMSDAMKAQIARYLNGGGELPD